MKRLDWALLTGVVVLLLATLAWPAARHMLVLQVRLVFRVPPAHPQFVSPWFRSGGCTIFFEPRMDVTHEDYEWLLDRHSDSWCAHIAAAVGTPGPGDEEAPGASPQARNADQAFRERLTRRATELARSAPEAQAALLAVRLRRWPPMTYLKPLEGVQDATSAETLPRAELEALLEPIATGEREDRGNAYWPVMRMAVNAATGDFDAALAALREAATTVAFRDFDDILDRMVVEAWANEGVPVTSCLNYASASVGTLGYTVHAVRLMAAHAAFLERHGRSDEADAIYADLLDVAALVADGPMRPRTVTRVLTTRAHIMEHGELNDSLPYEQRIQGEDALRQFVDALHRRDRRDLARRAVACARIENRAVTELRALDRESGSRLLRLLLLSDLIWWPQVFLIPFASLLCVAGMCANGLATRWGRLRAARRGALLALLVMLAIYGTWLLLWGLQPPEYGFRLGPSRAEIITERVAGIIVWLLPMVFAVLAWRLGWMAPVHAVAQTLRRVGIGCVRVGMATVAFVLALGLADAWICRAAIEFAFSIQRGIPGTPY